MSTSENQMDQPTSLGEDATQAHLVKTERVGSVWIVTINRLRVRNAIDGPTAQALTNAFQQFEHTADLSVAVLTGAGRTFCSGIDLTAFPDEQRLLHLAEEGVAPLGLARLVLSKPCFAAIEGYALAGGFELASGAICVLQPQMLSLVLPIIAGAFLLWMEPLCCFLASLGRAMPSISSSLGVTSLERRHM